MYLLTKEWSWLVHSKRNRLCTNCLVVGANCSMSQRNFISQLSSYCRLGSISAINYEYPMNISTYLNFAINSSIYHTD